MNLAAEVIYQASFTIVEKMGIFSEIYYNPYQGEVLRISMRSAKSKQTSTSYDIAHYSA